MHIGAEGEHNPDSLRPETQTHAHTPDGTVVFQHWIENSLLPWSLSHSITLTC